MPLHQYYHEYIKATTTMTQTTTNTVDLGDIFGDADVPQQIDNVIYYVDVTSYSTGANVSIGVTPAMRLSGTSITLPVQETLTVTGTGRYAFVSKLYDINYRDNVPLWTLPVPSYSMTFNCTSWSNGIIYSMAAYSVVR